MSVEGRIAGIFVSHVPPEDKKQMGGAPVLGLKSANLVAGSGIESTDGIRDRYFDKNGAYSKVRPEVRQLSLITRPRVIIISPLFADPSYISNSLSLPTYSIRIR